MDSSLLTAVEDVLRQVAEQEIMSRFKRLGEGDVRRKGAHGDLVTAADLEAENRLREGLVPLLPGSAFIGEEEVYKFPQALDLLLGDAPVWVVDPLDGTRNFAQGEPCFAVICALVQGGATHMGWIYDPISDTCARVRRGHGAHLAGQPLTIRGTSMPVAEMRGSLGERIQPRLKDKPGAPSRLMRYHCVAREYMDLALGKLHFAMYGGRLMPWDHAAGALLVEEAGGFVRTITGKKAYSPVHHGHGERLLIAPDEAAFDTLADLLIP